MRNRLQWAVRALAQPADVQLSLFPDFVCKADELALNFEDGLYEMVGHEDEVTEEQRAAIGALERLLTVMSGKQNAQFWTDEAVRSFAIWEEIRGLARNAAAAFGWDLRPPPPSGDIYLPSGGRG